MKQKLMCELPRSLLFQTILECMRSRGGSRNSWTGQVASSAQPRITSKGKTKTLIKWDNSAHPLSPQNPPIHSHLNIDNYQGTTFIQANLVSAGDNHHYTLFSPLVQQVGCSLEAGGSHSNFRPPTQIAEPLQMLLSRQSTTTLQAVSIFVWYQRESWLTYTTQVMRLDSLLSFPQ